MVNKQKLEIKELRNNWTFTNKTQETDFNQRLLQLEDQLRQSEAGSKHIDDMQDFSKLSGSESEDHQQLYNQIQQLKNKVDQPVHIYKDCIEDERKYWKVCATRFFPKEKQV